MSRRISNLPSSASTLLKKLLKTTFKFCLKWPTSGTNFSYLKSWIYFNWILNFQVSLIKVYCLFKEFSKFRSIIRDVPKSLLKHQFFSQEDFQDCFQVFLKCIILRWGFLIQLIRLNFILITFLLFSGFSCAVAIFPCEVCAKQVVFSRGFSSFYIYFGFQI